MASKTFRTTLLGERIPLTFDPKKVFGKLRVPVRVTLRGHSYRSTIFSMDGCTFVPLRRSHREAAGLEGTEVVTVRLDLDTDKRVVKPPTDLVEALKAAAPAWERWRELSYTHQREYAEAVREARKPETRTRRIAAAVRALRARSPRKR